MPHEIISGHDMSDWPTTIEVRGARVHNLKNIDVSVPLGELVGIAGVSGSGKSSLALGVLYAEGSRRYLEALSTYTRRRLTQSARASVDEVEHVPAALALRQRPGVPGVRSTFGTSTELLNSLRLLFSRLSSHQCPNGHHVPPTMNVALMKPITCPVCQVQFYGPGAESLAFNSEGACPRCQGTGIVRDVDDSTLVPDPTLTIDQGAVAPWHMFGIRDVMQQAVVQLGVRIDVPFNQLTDRELDIVFHGPEVKREVTIPSKSGKVFDLNLTYRNARDAVEKALDKANSEQKLARINRFLSVQVCPECHGSRLSPAARAPLVLGINLAQVTAKTLDALIAWLPGIGPWLPADMRPMAASIIGELTGNAQRLLDLGLGYLALDRAAATLSTGERQRVQLSRAVRNQTTGVLYVLDEPSIGLHPSNVDGLLSVIGSLLDDGNSVVVVDHDVRVLRQADWLIEIGPGSGSGGGTVVSTGTVEKVSDDPASRIGGFLSGARRVEVRTPVTPDRVFTEGRIHLETAPLHTVHALSLDLPRGRLSAITGVSGSGKTTLILESLVPALRAAGGGERLPSHVRALDAPGVARTNLIDSSPIGINVRSTVATYSGVLDDLRRAYAQTPDARRLGYKTGDFSFNTGKLRCPTCEGTGQISLDVQFLPDVTIVCPECHGRRYAPAADDVLRPPKPGPGAGEDEDAGALSLPSLLALTVDDALARVADLPKVHARLQVLRDLGLGYLTLGEATPALSGGEAQRLKLASELGRDQRDAVFVFDEPTVGLHPLDVEVLLGVFERLIDHGATVIVIEHDLDVIANSDYIVDLGPGGGEAGGRIIATGTPSQIMDDPQSVIGRYLREDQAPRHR